MKYITLSVLMFLSSNLFAQNNIIGHYKNHFGNRIKINSDFTYNYTYYFDLISSWTNGTWSVKKDTIYLKPI